MTNVDRVATRMGATHPSIIFRVGRFAEEQRVDDAGSNLVLQPPILQVPQQWRQHQKEAENADSAIDTPL